MIDLLFKQSLQHLHGYQSPPQTDIKVKLNQNESPFDLPGPIKETIYLKAKSLAFNRYPVNESPELKSRLANWHDVKPEQIILGNGSNQLLQTLMSACIEKGEKVLYCPPTFSLFDIFTRLYDGIQVVVLSPPDDDPPRQQILRAIGEEKPKLILLCSPNNPTGAEFNMDFMREICALASGLVMVDEAYGEFSDQSFSQLLNDYPHLIISRTFSKAFSMAGLRLGYFIASTEVIAQLQKINLPYNINLFTELVGCSVLDHKETFLAQLQFIKDERMRLQKAMGSIDKIAVYPSAANFLLFKIDNSQGLFNHLKNKGILVRDVSDFICLNNHLRVTIGNSEENQFFFHNLLEYVNL